MMTETNGFVETFATLEFEGNALLSAMLLDNLSGDAGSINDVIEGQPHSCIVVL